MSTRFVFDTSHVDVIEEWLRINPSATITLPVGDPLGEQQVVYVCQTPGSAEREDQTELLALARLIAASQDLLDAVKAQHDAIDILFAMLIVRDGTFFPSKSGRPWEALLKGNTAQRKAEGKS